MKDFGNRKQLGRRNWNGKENAGHISSEDRDTNMEIEESMGLRGGNRKTVDGWEGNTSRNVDACNTQLQEEPGWSSGK